MTGACARADVDAIGCTDLVGVGSKDLDKKSGALLEVANGLDEENDERNPPPPLPLFPLSLLERPALSLSLVNESPKSMSRLKEAIPKSISSFGGIGLMSGATSSSSSSVSPPLSSLFRERLSLRG
jgi:hypothetical protein